MTDTADTEIKIEPGQIWVFIGELPGAASGHTVMILRRWRESIADGIFYWKALNSDGEHVLAEECSLRKHYSLITPDGEAEGSNCD